MESQDVSAVDLYLGRAARAAAVLAAAALAASPLWAAERPDRIAGFVVGAGASALRLIWGFHLARTFDGRSPARYAAARAAGLVPLAAALFVAGLADGVDLASAAVGVVLGTVASIAAAVTETRGTSGA
jgi:hypothetical protein